MFYYNTNLSNASTPDFWIITPLAEKNHLAINFFIKVCEESLVSTYLPEEVVGCVASLVEDPSSVEGGSITIHLTLYKRSLFLKYNKKLCT